MTNFDILKEEFDKLILVNNYSPYEAMLYLASKYGYYYGKVKRDVTQYYPDMINWFFTDYKPESFILKDDKFLKSGDKVMIKVDNNNTWLSAIFMSLIDNTFYVTISDTVNSTIKSPLIPCDYVRIPEKDEWDISNNINILESIIMVN